MKKGFVARLTLTLITFLALGLLLDIWTAVDEVKASTYYLVYALIIISSFGMGHVFGSEEDLDKTK